MTNQNCDRIFTPMKIRQKSLIFTHLESSIREIESITGLPFDHGNVAEFLGNQIFNIELAPPKQKGFDGWFKSGMFNGQPLKGKTVNVKWYMREDKYHLDMTKAKPQPDYYLVFKGPKKELLGWYINYVFIFHTETLSDLLDSRDNNVGTSSSVKQGDWGEAQIYPALPNSPMKLNQDQKSKLRIFRHG